MTKLIEAVKKSNFQEASDLIKQGVDVNEVMIVGEEHVKTTALSSAIIRYNLEMVQLLTQHGANIESCYNNGPALSLTIRKFVNEANFYEDDNDLRMNILVRICAHLLSIGAELHEDDILYLAWNLNEKLKSKNPICSFLAAEALIRVDIDCLNRILQVQLNWLPTPDDLEKYLEISPRNLNSIQYERICNTLDLLGKNVEQYRNVLKSFVQHDVNIQLHPNSTKTIGQVNDANMQMEVLRAEGSIKNHSTQEIIAGAIAPLIEKIEMQNQKLNELSIQLSHLTNENIILRKEVNQLLAANVLTQNAQTKPVMGLFK